MRFKTYQQTKAEAEALSKGEPDIYVYENAPRSQLRHQLCMIFSEAIGNYHTFGGYEFDTPPNGNTWWEEVDKICLKEIDSYRSWSRSSSPQKRFLDFVHDASDINEFLSAAHVGCVCLSTISEYDLSARGASSKGEDAIEEINDRFRQHSFGFEYVQPQIYKKAFEYVHSEVVKPALLLTSNSSFSKVNADFRNAHQLYLDKKYKDSINAANRVFESTLKAVCELRGWNVEKGDRASDLVKRVVAKGLFSSKFDKSFDCYVALMKTGLPTIRNEFGGHGETSDAIAVTAGTARLALNFSAALILFIIEAHESTASSK